MAIGFDAASNSGYQAASSGYSWNHTCAADGELFVGISIPDGSGASVSALSFNGVALTKLGHVAEGDCRVELWALDEPATGTHSIAVTLSSAVDSIGTAQSVTGVRHDELNYDIASAAATNGGAADAEFSDATSWGNGVIVGCIATTDGSITSDGGQTERANVSGSLGSGAFATKGAATDFSLKWTDVGAGAAWAVIGVIVRARETTAIGGCTIGAVTAAIAATHVKPTYTGAVAATIGRVNASISASHVPPTSTGAIVATTGPVTASGTASFASSLFTASGAVTTAPAAAAISAAFSAGTDTGALACTIAPVTAELSGTFSPGTKTASAAITIAHVTASLSGTVTNPAYSGAIAVTIGAAGTISAATFTEGSGWWPWCCCEEGSFPCDHCADPPGNPTVIAAGFPGTVITDNCTTCDVMNGTFLPDPIGNCEWEMPVATRCDCTPTIFNDCVIYLGVEIFIDSGDAILQVTFFGGKPAATFSFVFQKNLGTVPATCAGTHVLTLVSDSGHCGIFSPTCSVEIP